MQSVSWITVGFSGSIKKEPKQVIFSDGIKPGGDLSESPSSSISTPSQPPESAIVNYKHPSLAVSSTLSTKILTVNMMRKYHNFKINCLGPRQKELQCFLPDNDTSAPPILMDGQSMLKSFQRTIV